MREKYQTKIDVIRAFGAPTKKEVYNSEIKKRSEEELIEEETRNQQTIDIFIESDKNWC